MGPRNPANGKWNFEVLPVQKQLVSPKKSWPSWGNTIRIRTRTCLKTWPTRSFGKSRRFSVFCGWSSWFFFLRNPPVMFMGISPKQLVVLHPWKLTVMEPPKKFVVWVDASLLFRNSWDFFVFQVLGLSFSWGGSVVRRRICFILCPDVLSLIGVVDAALLCCNYRRMPQNWKKNHAKNVGAVEVWLGTPFNFSDNAKLGGLKWLFFIPMWRFFNWLILYCMF